MVLNPLRFSWFGQEAFINLFSFWWSILTNGRRKGKGVPLFCQWYLSSSSPLWFILEGIAHSVKWEWQLWKRISRKKNETKCVTIKNSEWEWRHNTKVMHTENRWSNSFHNTSWKTLWILKVDDDRNPLKTLLFKGYVPYKVDGDRTAQVRKFQTKAKNHWR